MYQSVTKSLINKKEMINITGTRHFISLVDDIIIHQLLLFFKLPILYNIFILRPTSQISTIKNNLEYHDFIPSAIEQYYNRLKLLLALLFHI